MPPPTVADLRQPPGTNLERFYHYLPDSQAILPFANSQDGYVCHPLAAARVCWNSE